MGLDMYLKRHMALGLWPHVEESRPDEYKAAVSVIEAVGMEVTERSAQVEVSVPVAYWRKANAIHGWFVTNVQNGVDDCRSYYVSEEKLRRLMDRCNLVLAGKVVRDDPDYGLPTHTGFFFGSTEYGDWYEAQLRETVEMIDKALAWEPPQGVTVGFDAWYEYEASW